MLASLLASYAWLLPSAVVLYVQQLNDIAGERCCAAGPRELVRAIHGGGGGRDRRATFCSRRLMRQAALEFCRAAFGF